MITGSNLPWKIIHLVYLLRQETDKLRSSRSHGSEAKKKDMRITDASVKRFTISTVTEKEPSILVHILLCSQLSLFESLQSEALPLSPKWYPNFTTKQTKNQVQTNWQSEASQQRHIIEYAECKKQSNILSLAASGLHMLLLSRLGNATNQHCTRCFSTGLNATNSSSWRPSRRSRCAECRNSFVPHGTSTAGTWE